MTRTGQCRCGAIRYTLDADPLVVRQCWCRDCQYWAAGNATVNLVVPRAALHVHGTPRTWQSTADSGHHMTRSFCGDCGTPMFSSAAENLEALVVRAGTLDNIDSVRPQGIIWTDSAPAWAVHDPQLPQAKRQS